jgi:predicted Zn-ribbon and HTH transcriptional regulator
MSTDRISTIIVQLYQQEVDEDLIVEINSMLRYGQEAAERVQEITGVEFRPKVTVQMPHMQRQPHSRDVPLTLFEIICQRCEQHVSFWRYPGKPPRVCPACKDADQRERERNKKRRQRGKG